AITGEGGLSGSDVGKIEIFSSFSLVELSTPLSPETSRRIGTARVAGQSLRIRPDGGRPGRPYRGRSEGDGDRPARPHRARGEQGRPPRAGRPGADGGDRR